MWQKTPSKTAEKNIWKERVLLGFLELLIAFHLNFGHRELKLREKIYLFNEFYNMQVAL